ncbi:MAG: single-stranded DNA-binding protein [Planctomycetota bacterium]|nr:single-stranded DNA-binding protein [Planctomycetota bacterium]
MASFNKVILMGNLTRDPELRFTPNNMPICKFGLAVNRRFKDGQSGEWKEEPTFVDVTIFGARAEPFAKYHQKGKVAFIEGTLRMDTWEDKNGGGKRSKLYVVADTWEFVGSSGARSEGGGAGAGGGFERGGASSTGGGGGGGMGGGGGSMPQGEPEQYQQADDTPF